MKINKQVLVAENDPTTRIALVMLLQEMGLTVFETDSGNEALEILRSQTIDLIIVNLQLPHMAGVELIAQAQKISSSAEIITLSEIVNTTVYEHMRKLDVFRMFALPLKLEEVKDGVLRALSSVRTDRLKAEKPLENDMSQDSVRILVAHSDIGVFQKILEIGLAAGWNVDYAENKEKFRKVITAGFYNVIVIADSLLDTLETNDSEPLPASPCKPVVFVISNSRRQTGRNNLTPASQILYLPALFTKGAFLEALKSRLPELSQARKKTPIVMIADGRDTEQSSLLSGSMQSLKKKLLTPFVILYCLMIILAGMIGFWISNSMGERPRDADNSQQSDLLRQMQQYQGMKEVYERKGK